MTAFSLVSTTISLLSASDYHCYYFYYFILVCNEKHIIKLSQDVCSLKAKEILLGRILLFDYRGSYSVERAHAALAFNLTS